MFGFKEGMFALKKGMFELEALKEGIFEFKESIGWPLRKAKFEEGVLKIALVSWLLCWLKGTLDGWDKSVSTRWS